MAQQLEVGGPVETLPSELYEEYLKLAPDETRDYENLLQNCLSSLACQGDLSRGWKRGETQVVTKWIWKTLTAPIDEANEERQTQQPPKPELPEFQWWTGAKLLQSILPKIPPFEVHTIASQSIVFTDSSRAHWSFCILLCVQSLRQCPSPIEKRWKRWQSLLCETVRLFQNYGIELGDLAVPMWIQHLIPACQHVIAQLPSEAYHTAFLSSLIGTISTLVVRECERPQKEDEDATSVLPNVLQLLEALRTVVYHGENCNSEYWIFLDPWRVHSFCLSMDEVCHDEVEFIQHHNEIAWWSQRAHRHERVAGMDTSWDDLGISLLALIAFEERPLVFTHAFTWKVWFPHVKVLFKTSIKFPFLEHLPLTLLDNLVLDIPDQSLPPVSSTSNKPDSPFETFQLLSNRLVPDVGKAMNGNDGDSKERSERIVTLMKSLLSRYGPINQVKIIRKLVHDCPHPGLQAKFMDLLRPIIFVEDAHDAFWTYIGSFVKDLSSHVDEDKELLEKVEDLKEKVELYVGAITMIQLWSMVKGRLPKRIRGHSLGRFYKILKKTIEGWMENSLSMPPDDYYRLYLLEGALQQVLQILGEAHRRRKLDGEGDTSPSKERSSSGSAGHQAPSAVVGEVEIFS